MTALAPIVEGPLVAGLQAVRVSGALAGAEVIILVDAMVAARASPGVNGSLSVPLSAALVAGQSVTARQRQLGIDGPESSVPVPVLRVPSPLPAVVFLSPMSQFMRHVLLGGLVPGADIEIRNAAIVVGRDTARGASQWVFVDPALIGAGVTLTATQTQAGETSPVATSVALASVNARFVPQPQIGLPVTACQTVLSVLAAIPAAEIEASNAGNVTAWTNVGAAYGAWGAAPFVAGRLAVVQSLPGAGTRSETLFIDVGPAVTPSKPEMRAFCPDSRQISVGGLMPGAVLSLSAAAFNAPETPIGDIGISASVIQVDLPAIIGGSGPIMTIFARQSACGLTSPPGDATEFARPGSGALPIETPEIVGSLFDCTRWVRCKSLGLVPMRLVSDRSGQPLSGWHVPQTSAALVPLWLPLAAGDAVRIEQRGCGAPNGGAATPVQALPVPLPAPEIIQPVRPGASFVTLKGCVPGARVHLMVNGVVRAESDALDRTFDLAVPVALVAGQGLWCFQTLCTATSAPDGRPVVVTKGNLSVAVQPTSVVAGRATSLTVVARDGDTGMPVPGLAVSLGGVVVGQSGTPFNWTAPAVASVAGTVLGDAGHVDQGFAVTVLLPTTVSLGLYPGDDSLVLPGAISNVSWTVAPGWAGGVAKTLASATGTVVIDGAPAGGVAQISVKLTANFNATTLFPAESLTLGGVVAPLAFTKPAHAVSARVTVTPVAQYDGGGNLEGYRRLVEIKLFSLA